MTNNQKEIEELSLNPLRIGISTRALFDLEAEHDVFVNKGVRAYIDLQREREDVHIRKGTGFAVINRLLKLNEGMQNPLVEVVLMSRNSPDLSLRAFNSISHYQLPIKLGSFTSGRPIGPFIPAWDIDLFLSNEVTDVKAAAEAGAAAARLGKLPDSGILDDTNAEEVRFAFDGDSVVFSEESDLIYQADGLDTFIKHETEHAKNPMNAGPFGKFLKKLSKLRTIHIYKEEVSKIRIGIVTARNAPAHERVIQTLREWGTPADEAHFVGPNEKGPILAAMNAHIFFDDQEKHINSASSAVPSGHVPGPHSPNNPVIPAG